MYIGLPGFVRHIGIACCRLSKILIWTGLKTGRSRCNFQEALSCKHFWLHTTLHIIYYLHTVKDQCWCPTYHRYRVLWPASYSLFFIKVEDRVTHVTICFGGQWCTVGHVGWKVLPRVALRLNNTDNYRWYFDIFSHQSVFTQWNYKSEVLK